MHRAEKMSVVARAEMLSKIGDGVGSAFCSYGSDDDFSRELVCPD